MKTFLNVLGVLTLLGSGFVIMQSLGGGRGADLGAGFAGLVLAGFVLGLAKVIELLEAEHAVAAKHRALEVKFWELTASRLPSDSPVAPPAPSWFVLQGEQVSGPFTRAQLEQLRGTGQLDRDTMVVLAGTRQWRPMTEVLR